MLINKTNFTYIIMIIALVLTGCTASQTAPNASSTSSAKAVSQGNPINTSSPTQTDQNCSNLPLSEAVIATPGNGMGLPTTLTAIDPTSGKQICGYAAIPLGVDVAVRISPDRKYLGSIDYSSGSSTNSKIRIVDLSSWVTIDTDFQFPGWVSSITFSPDSSLLALSYQVEQNTHPSNLQSSKIVLVDVRQSKVVDEYDLNFSPQFLHFTGSGNQIIAIGGPDYYFKSGEDSANSVLDARGILIDIDNLKSNRWEIPLQDIVEGSLWTTTDNNPSGQEYHSAIQLSPDGRFIYIVHASEDKLTTVDLINKQISTVNIKPKLSLLEQLLTFGAGTAYAKELTSTSKQAVISPDGKHLFVLSLTMSPDPQNGFIQTSHGIQVIDTATGKEVGQLGTAATHIALSADGRELFLSNTIDKAWSEVVSTANLVIRMRFDRQFIAPILRQNGEEVIMSSSQGRPSSTQALIDPLTLQPINSWLWQGLTFEASSSVWPEY